MEGTIEIWGKTFEYDFLSGWIKYTRIKSEISQEALAYSICSTSHLSCFENGKKKLRGEIIEALLKKLGINEFVEIKDMGLFRQKLHNLAFLIEGVDYKFAKIVYDELLEMEELLKLSPSYLEYKIYLLMYNILVERKSYDALSQHIIAIDKIYSSLNDELKYIYMLSTGKLMYDFKSHSEGISRLLTAHKLKDAPYINFRLGVEYCNNLEPLKGVYYLEKALKVYETCGRYLNALFCHGFLGTCYTTLKFYEKAELHLNTMLEGLNYFSNNKNAYGISVNFTNLYFSMGNYKKCLEWSSIVMGNEDSEYTVDEDRITNKSFTNSPDQAIIGACFYVEACIKLNKPTHCNKIFHKYLKEEYKGFIHYIFLHCLYLSIFNAGEEILYKEITEIALPYYKKIGYLDIYRKLQYILIDYLEKKRKYKEANMIYREINEG